MCMLENASLVLGLLHWNPSLPTQPFKRLEADIQVFFSAFLLCWLNLNHVYREGCASGG